MLQNLLVVNYTGWEKEIPFHIHLGASPQLEEMNNIVTQFKWLQGTKDVYMQEKNIVLRSMWLDSIGSITKNASPNTLILIFEDDIQISESYFQCLLILINTYDRNPKCRNSNLVGFSPIPVRIIEMSKPNYRYLQKNYMSRACVWPGSWNRFMIDFMYARGLVMMYPNLPGEMGFATTLHEDGMTVWKKTNKAKDPRDADLVSSIFLLKDTGVFPSYTDLATFGLHMQPSTVEDLMFEGVAFSHNITKSWRFQKCGALHSRWAPSGVDFSLSVKEAQLCVANPHSSVFTISS